MKIGISGHQDLKSNSTIIWIKKCISEQMAILQPCATYSSLAIGADQLFAEVTIHLKLPLNVIIPCKHYENTFDEDHIEKFELLLSNAAEIITLNYPEPSEEAFYKAGMAIVESTDLLFAVWDGQEAKGLGGTGDIVNYANTLQKPVLHFNLIDKTIKYI